MFQRGYLRKPVWKQIWVERVESREARIGQKGSQKVVWIWFLVGTETF